MSGTLIECPLIKTRVLPRLQLYYTELSAVTARARPSETTYKDREETAVLLQQPSIVNNSARTTVHLRLGMFRCCHLPQSPTWFMSVYSL